ncbi:MAG: alpha/beta hydrolase [Planctomycetota bacterium]
MLEYRGYGESSGSPTERGVERDARAGLEWLVRERGVAPERILLHGRSLGTALAVHLASDDGAGVECAGLVLVSPLESGRAAADAMGLWPVAWAFGRPFDSIRRIESVAEPVLIVHGTDDRVLPYAGAERLAARAPNLVDLVTVEGADHDDVLVRAGPEFTRRIGELLDRVAPR